MRVLREFGIAYGLHIRPNECGGNPRVFRAAAGDESHRLPCGMEQPAERLCHSAGACNPHR